MKLSGILSLFASIAITCSSPLWAAAAKPGTTSARAAQPVKPRALAIPINPNNQVSNKQAITLSFPGEIRTDSLKVRLNGHEVTSAFEPVSCQQAYCLQATVGEGDGLHLGKKNVIAAMAKTQDGKPVTTRQRFLGGSAASTGLPKTANTKANAIAVADQGDPTPSWLPPTVAFVTNPGGYKNGYVWFTIGGITYPRDGTLNCSLASQDQYLTIVLDRQTLGERTDVSPHCSSNSADLSQFLSQRTSSDLVITGTVDLTNADNGLDTSAIGGTNYTNLQPATNPQIPRGYMAIGVGGAAPGQAYENYYLSTYSNPTNPTAYGVLDEDMSGNYNFRSTQAVQFVVSPNDPSSNGESVITVGLPAGGPGTENGFEYNVYTSGPQTVGGYYLLVLDRWNLDSTATVDSTHCVLSDNAPNHVFENCGTFFPTASPDLTTRVNAYQNLAAALNAVTANQLIFLTTFENPAYTAHPNPINTFWGQWDVAETSLSTQNSAFYPNLVGAMQNLGANPQDMLYLFQNTPNGTPSTYTLITGPGLGDSLTGSAIISTTYNSQQHQTGYVHGILQRDRLGMYKPGQSSQEIQGKDNSDFSITVVNNMMPVDWPSNSSTTQLPGADSIKGQRAAFNYLSWELLHNYYIKGVVSPYEYDIHYFFTGSLNTFIDYHHFDPNDAVWPGTAGFGVNGHVACASVDSNGCNWTSPDGTTLDPFTQNDFNAVKAQVSTEVVDLTNVLQFMVNGSVNMKDVVAGGSANTGLALVGAASEVQASLAGTKDKLTQASQAPAKVNAMNILSQIGSGVAFVAGVGTGTLGLDEDTVKIADKALTIVGGLFSEAGGIGGSFPSKGGTTQLPNTDYTFYSTLGEIANSDLQGDLSAGFDTVLDSILGDWGKLSTIGGYVVDTTNPAFYSPNQVAQNLVIKAFSQASQRSFYLQMVPQFYYLDLWPQVYGAADMFTQPHFAPDMGYYYTGSATKDRSCTSFYPWTSAPAWSGFAWPAYGAIDPSTNTGSELRMFTQDPHYAFDNSLNFSVLGSAVANPGSTDPATTVEFMDGGILSQLFDADKLNISQSAFYLETGPMNVTRPDGTSAVRRMWEPGHDPNGKNALASYFGFEADQICSWNDISGSWPHNPTPTSGLTGPQAPASATTTTKLTLPATASAGDPVQLQATVTSDSGTVNTGTVVFYEDGVQVGIQELGPTNTASVTLSNLTAGTHSVWAGYLNNHSYGASDSGHATLTVYSASPEIALSLSTATVPISYGSASSSVTLQATSKSGLNGNVVFSCSGMPIGMSCSFTPATATIIDGQTVTTKLTITAAPLQTSSIRKLSGVGSLALILPLALFGFKRNRKGMRIYQILGCFAVLGLGIAIAGCGGSGSKTPTSKSVQETGSKTILVNATCGSVTRAVPLILNIQ